MTPESYDSFESVKTRLDEIVEAVGSDDMPLDDALALYEEAVTLGLRASDLLEENIAMHNADDAAMTPDRESSAEVDQVSDDDVAVDATAGGNADADVSA